MWRRGDLQETTKLIGEATSVRIVFFSKLEMLVEPVIDIGREFQILGPGYLLVITEEVAGELQSWLLVRINFVVVIFLVGIILEYLDYRFIVTPSLFRVARVFRIGRLLRFYKGARGIRRLLFALVISLPALFNIGALLFLVMFIYAIIGMSSFGYVKKTGALNDVVNFETFGNSMLLLFRLSTSAGWNDVLEPLLIQPPDCDENHLGQPYGNCGIPWLAILYFITFILSTFLIIINMYIAIILENLSQAHQQGRSRNHGRWLGNVLRCIGNVIDPDASQYILHSQLSDFVDGLEQPLRIPHPEQICVHSFKHSYQTRG